MHKTFHNILFGISVLPALLVMPALAEEITERQVLNEDTVLDGVSATNIENSSTGGVILSYNKLVIKNSEFSGNSSGAAAVLYDNSLTAYKNGGTYSVTIDNSSFTDNSAGDFGAVAIFSPGSSVSNSTFSNNRATANYANLGDGAGALFLGSESQTVISESIFSHNSSGTIGGAVATRPINYWLDTNYSGRGTNSSEGAKVDILSSTFEYNSAGTRGGAFFNSVYDSDAKAGYAYINDSYFNNNDANLGGAIFVEGWTDSVGNNAKLWVENSHFNNNAAESNGGAIYNESVLTVNNNEFKNNTASENGGAIYNYVSLNYDGEIESIGDLTVNGGLFDSNVASARGGAIYNYGTATIDGAVFTGNKTTNITWESQGGAIFNSGDDDYLDVPSVTMVISNTTFGDVNDNTKGNSALQGGAIANESSLVDGLVTLNNVNFYYNKAFADTDDSDGYNSTLGGAVWNQGIMTVNGDTLFRGNTATGYNVEGGAIYNSGTLTFNDAVTFDSNVATDLNSGNGAYGGAIANSYGAEIVFKKLATFTNNSALSSADKGTQGGAINNQNSIVFEQGASFSGNTAVYGGAVFNEETLTIDGASTFDSNIAVDEGGAMFNLGDVDLTSAAFTNNSAESNGGAIANYAGNITFSGTNVFQGNTANGSANDIYNRGRITFVDGSTTTMDGGITGDGTLNIASGATFNLGTASVTQGTLVLDGTLNATLQDANNFASFDIADSFGGDGGTLNLVLRGAGEYNVFQGAVFDNANVAVSSGVFDYEWNEGFDTITATMKSTEDIAAENGISAAAATTVANLVNSSSDELNDLANAIQDKLASGDTDAAAAVEQAHAAIHPETESVVQSVAMHVQNTVANLAAGRLTALTLGRGGGDVDITAGGVWAQGIYNKSKQNDAFRGYTRGVAGGVDMTMNRVLTLGAGYSYAHSDITGTARDTEVDSSTIFAYGQYKPTDWFVNAMANYTMSDYSEHAVALGTNIDANYDVRSYGGQVMTGYDFAGGITPAVGVRYMHISADEYKNSLGIKNKLQDSDYMTAVLETRWTYGFKLNRGLMLKPELRYAVKYDFMSDDQVATILLPGVDSYALNGTRLSRLGAEFGGGLGIRAGGLDLSVNYEIEIREGFTSQTGRARIRYEF